LACRGGRGGLAMVSPIGRGGQRRACVRVASAQRGEARVVTGGKGAGKRMEAVVSTSGGDGQRCIG
jgi:hypothetical protein